MKDGVGFARLSRLMVKASHLFVVSALFWVANLGLANTDHHPCVAALERLNNLIDRNFFETRRDFQHYAQLLPQSFLDRLSSLKPSDHWLDAGSGEMFALEDFFQTMVFNPNQLLLDSGPNYGKARTIQMDPNAIRLAADALNHKDYLDKPKVTGVSYRMFRPAPNNPHLSVKTGRFFEDIPIEEFAQTDLITDVYGVASYTPKLWEVLSRYHKILKPGGKAYIFIGDYVESSDPSELAGWDAPFAQSRVRLPDGSQITLLDWVKKISGFRVSIESRRVEQKARFGGGKTSVLRSTIVLDKSGDEFYAPELRLLNADDGKPPHRIFEQVSNH